MVLESESKVERVRALEVPMRARICLILAAVLLISCAPRGAPEALPTPTAAAPARATHTPLPAPEEGIILNGGFGVDTAGWQGRIGRLEHTTSVFHAAPGAASLTTTRSDDVGGFKAVLGECIDLSASLECWPVVDGRRWITLEAWLKTDPDVLTAALYGYFGDDTRCRLQASGEVAPPPVSGSQEWTHVVATAEIPESARCIDVWLHAAGRSATATLWLDDVRAYPGSPK